MFKLEKRKYLVLYQKEGKMLPRLVRLFILTSLLLLGYSAAFSQENDVSTLEDKTEQWLQEIESSYCLQDQILTDLDGNQVLEVITVWENCGDYWLTIENEKGVQALSWQDLYCGIAVRQCEGSWPTVQANIFLLLGFTPQSCHAVTIFWNGNQLIYQNS
ncbi:MAG: hypothetical protein ABIB97_01610 [Patescibacteria group bacterium]